MPSHRTRLTQPVIPLIGSKQLREHSYTASHVQIEDNNGGPLQEQFSLWYTRARQYINGQLRRYVCVTEGSLANVSAIRIPANYSRLFVAQQSLYCPRHLFKNLRDSGFRSTYNSPRNYFAGSANLKKLCFRPVRYDHHAMLRWIAATRSELVVCIPKSQRPSSHLTRRRARRPRPRL